jgi:predicted nuclease of predicted toxin-antitoxin system
MKIKLDHNLSRHLTGVLQAFGHDVDTAFEEGLARSSDREILHEATEQGRILFTLDPDFLNLKTYPPRNHSGVIVFRPTRQGARAVTKIVEALFEARI